MIWFLFALNVLSGPLDTALSEEMLFKHLNPLSLSEQLSFYHLYPETPYGKQALQRVWALLQKEPSNEAQSSLALPPFNIEMLISFVTRQPSDPLPNLSEEELSLIETLAKPLANRKLPGSRIWTKETLDALPVHEIDLGRGLLINQLSNKTDIRKYEATLDLMALQILAHLPANPSPQEKIRAMNSFIFHEMNFRFPPHSTYAKSIDLYSFLPSVLDNRQGVCLGVSILYLCLAQRLDLTLEIITPPGHIYVRHNQEGRIINIETTARGIDLPSETYLGVDTRLLPKRNLREVIGMVFYNHASLCWDTREYKQGASLYEKARVYMPDDPQLKMLLAFSYLLSGKVHEGKNLLEQGVPFLFDEAVSSETMAEDYLKGRVDLKGIKTIFSHVDKTQESILKKQKKIQKALKRCPLFREGWFNLAVTYLQLGRESEAYATLQHFHRLDPNNATAAYYLSILALESLDYKQSWTYLKQAESLTKKRSHYPPILHSLRQHLKRLSPEIASAHKVEVTTPKGDPGYLKFHGHVRDFTGRFVE